MPPHLSLEMRKNIVRWRFEQGKTGKEIATLVNCSESTIWEVLRLHRKYDQVTKPHTQNRGRGRALDNADVQYLSSLLLANPVLYLDELQEQLATVRNVEVSISTLSRTLRRTAVSNKSVSNKAAERNELLRATWQAEYGDIPAEYFVWLDEYDRERSASTIVTSHITVVQGPTTADHNFAETTTPGSYATHCKAALEAQNLMSQ